MYKNNCKYIEKCKSALGCVFFFFWLIVTRGVYLVSWEESEVTSFFHKISTITTDELKSIHLSTLKSSSKKKKKTSSEAEPINRLETQKNQYGPVV